MIENKHEILENAVNAYFDSLNTYTPNDESHMVYCADQLENALYECGLIDYDMLGEFKVCLEPLDTSDTRDFNADMSFLDVLYPNQAIVYPVCVYVEDGMYFLIFKDGSYYSDDNAVHGQTN